MSASTPGFVGERLRQARAIREMTSVSLASRIGISPATLTHYERGRHTPTPYHFAQIAKALDFKPEFFLRPLEQSAPEQVSFARSRSTATRTMYRRAEYRRVWMRDIVGYLAQFLPLPELDIPTPDLDFDWRSVSTDNIETLASEVRAHWKLTNGPISNVTLLSEKHGVIAVRFPFGSAALDAFSTWDRVDGRPYMALGADGQSAVRTRFNVCHELAHLVMHRNVTPNELSERSNFNLIEQQAHRFAAAFLVPASSFVKDLKTPTLDALRVLKPRWKASVKMLIHRTHDLGLIDEDYARRLYINYNRRGWNLSEPYDEDLAVESPGMVRHAFQALVDREIVVRAQVPADLPFNQDELEQLAGLPPGYFDDLPEDSDMWGFLDSLTADFPSHPPGGGVSAE